MTQDFVIIKGTKFFVKNGELNLNNLGLTDIDQIEGLENLINLKKLDLGDNELEEIKGLENFTNLEELNLYGNPIDYDELSLVGKSAQDVVSYYRDKKEGTLEFVIVESLVGYLNHYVLNGKLKLDMLDIKDISEIEGLENLSKLQKINLSKNLIEEIKGVDHLLNLEELILDENPIKED